MYFIPGDVRQVQLLIHSVSLKLQQTRKQYSKGSSSGSINSGWRCVIYFLILILAKVVFKLELSNMLYTRGIYRKSIQPKSLYRFSFVFLWTFPLKTPCWSSDVYEILFSWKKFPCFECEHFLWSCDCCVITCWFSFFSHVSAVENLKTN